MKKLDVRIKLPHQFNRRKITMNNTCCTTNEQERKRGQHLKAEERGAIQSLKRLGYLNRVIARELNCSSSTIGMN